MTMDPSSDTANNSKGYEESKKNVLSHYFDELLPPINEDEKSVDQESRKLIVDEADKSIKSEKPPLASRQETEIEKDKQAPHVPQSSTTKPSLPTLPPVVTSVVPPIVPPPAASTSALISEPSEKVDAISESSKPIPHKTTNGLPTVLTPIESRLDGSDGQSTGYADHKQRLEKMLHQLTEIPVDTDTSTALESAVDAKALSVTESLTEEAEPKIDTTPDVSTFTDTAVDTVALSSEWLENDRPHWAQEHFDILLIDVNGLKLAVPLIALGHIEPISEELTPLFGQANWFLGIQKTPFGNIKTIDTAQYVMPERVSEDKPSKHTYQFVVSINGMNWGLAVDNIDQPIQIDPDSIRWRAKRENRPWMAGTVKDHMCILLDIPVMGEILLKEDQNHSIQTGE